MSQSTESPSREELLKELSQINSNLDRIPYQSDISEMGNYTAQAYQNEFGSWNDALAAAGIDKEEELLQELQRVTDEIGKKPTQAEMNSRGRYSSSMYARYFGQWSTAKDRLDEWSSESNSKGDERADVSGSGDTSTETSVASNDNGFEWDTPLEKSSSDSEPQDSTTDSSHNVGADYSEEELIQYLTELSNKFGEPPTREFVKHYGSYPVGAYLDQFGSWEEALEAADLPQIDIENRGARRKHSRVEILDILVEYAAQEGEVPDPLDVWMNTELSAISVSNRFGDHSTAFELAGITEEAFNHDVQQSDTEEPTPNREGVLTELKRIGTPPSDPPSPAEFERQSILSVVTVRNEFETWANALKKAGYDDEAIGTEEEYPQGYLEQELLEEIRRVTIHVGAVPTTSDFDNHADMTSQTVKNSFKTWENALENAGVEGLGPSDVEKLLNEYKLPDKKTLLQEIGWVDDAVAGRTTAADVRTFARYPEFYFNEVFGSVENAIEALRRDQD